MADIAYLKHRECPLPMDMEIMQNPNIQEICKERNESRKVLKDMLKHCHPGDRIFVATVTDLGTVSSILSLLRKLEKKRIVIVSLSEPWFSTEDESYKETLLGLAHLSVRKKRIERR